MQAVAKARDSSDHPVRENVMEERLRVNLARFITESGYTANQVADMAGIPQATLGRYVRGENAISADVLPSLAAVFGRDIGDFYNANPPPAPQNLEEAQPLFFRARPGVTVTAEDLRDWEEFLEKVKTRRAKKLPPKKR